MWWKYYLLFSTTTFFVTISYSLNPLYLAATFINEQDKRLCEFEKSVGLQRCQTWPALPANIAASRTVISLPTHTSDETSVELSSRSGQPQQQFKRDSQPQYNQRSQTSRLYLVEQGDSKESQQPLQMTYAQATRQAPTDNRTPYRSVTEQNMQQPHAQPSRPAQAELPHLGSISHQPPQIQFPSGSEQITKEFSAKLHHLISRNYPNVNVIYSPISVQTALALIYTGATRQTAQELQRALDLPSSKVKVLEIFQSLPKSRQSGEFILTMASKLFHNQNLQVNSQFTHNARTYFDSDAVPLNFASPQMAANQINQFISKATNHRIRNVIEPQSLDPRTSAILVNAIYFKAKWFNEFSSDETTLGDFHDISNQKVTVPMMNNEDTFRFVDMPNNHARVLQLAYRDTDLSMLIILPTEMNGLAAVENSFQNYDFRRLLRTVKPETVRLQLPKFRVEFELDMVEALKMLDIKNLFTNNAELDNIFQNQASGISSIKHKAFIDINEAGSEAAAITYTKFIPLSLPSNLIQFRVNHPFMFAIVSPQAVYFVGHVVKI